MKIKGKWTKKKWAMIAALGPGVRNYRGKKTLFYKGEKLWEGDYVFGGPLVYGQRKRNTWQVIIILPGVEIIPAWTFYDCKNVKTVIMSDTVKRIEDNAFWCCDRLVVVRLSKNLEYIGDMAFSSCKRLRSIFIPPSCREIEYRAFDECHQLIILNVPQQTQLGQDVIANTKLIEASHFEADEDGEYENQEEIKTWIKNINQGEEHALHRACSSFNPRGDRIYAIVKRVGIQAFREPNSIGIAPAQYLEANYFGRVDQTKIINRYILNLMGEIV
ncbi:hypothetical protein CTEN210_13443 [Chaetoceros tenuissimus]|uniref:Leucine-rich repeat domain-containing protein n=1 Tax=Chaetoceros tenuissimus TaxID=426638 RepID=A0AAD3D339_9STRA|nr:hypothetical protein CTEN210_13443 [Chaetoceros tenuissimus]